MPAAPAMPPMLTVSEVAATLRVDPATVYRWCRSRELESVRVAGTVRIPADALERLASTASHDHEEKTHATL